MRALTLLTSGLMAFLGVGDPRTDHRRGRRARALGILVGLLFIAAGAGRLWATGALRRHRDEEDER